MGWKACDCSECVDMCTKRPCWGTPEEIEGLLHLGYGDRFMRDYWYGTSPDYNDIDIISPAIISYEGKTAPFWPTGRCTFLTVDGKCELHNTGFKPKEGRLAICGDGTPDDLHKEIAMEWDNGQAQDLANKWYEEAQK